MILSNWMTGSTSRGCTGTSLRNYLTYQAISNLSLSLSSPFLPRQHKDTTLTFSKTPPPTQRIIMSNMEEPRNSTVKQHKNKTVMHIGKAAPRVGHGGVGILFLGGAVATATFLFIKRHRKSSSNSKNRNQDQSTAPTEIPYKFIEDKYMHQEEVGGLHFDVPNSPAMDMDQNFRYETSSTGVREIDSTVISDETTSLQAKDGHLEANGRDEILVADGQDVTHSIPPKVLDNRTQFDASSIKRREFPLPIVVEEKALLQPTIVDNPLATQDLEKVQANHADGAVLVDQGIEEDHQDVPVNTAAGKMDADCWEEENTGKPHSKEAAETTKADQSMLPIVPSSAEQESSFCGCKESTSVGNSMLKNGEFVGEGSFQQLSGSSSLSDDENIDNHCEVSALAIKVAAVEKAEALETANEEHDKVDNKTEIIEVDSSLFPEHFGTDETNESDACSEDQGAEITTNLMFAEVEEKCNPHNCSLAIRAKENEVLEATDDFQEEGNTVLLMAAEGENLKKCQVGLPISEAMEVAEEVKVHEGADGKEETELLLVGEGKGAQNDAKMIGEQSQETRETTQFPDNNHQSLQIDITETSRNSYQEDTFASDEQTSECNRWENSSENVPLALFNTPANMKPEIRIDNGFEEVQQSVEASEVQKENVASEPGSEESFVEDLPIQLAEQQEKQEYLDDECWKTLEESEDAVQLRYESNVTPEEHKLMRSEENSNNYADETNLAEKVEESSEGTEDSSAEFNAEPIWPAESIQDLAMEPHKMDEDDPHQSMEEQSVENQADSYLKKVDSRGIMESRLQKADNNKCSLKLTLFEKCMLHLGELIHQTTNSQKRRILTLTIMMFSGSFCIWYFSLPFLKICLIVILIMVISKMHGF